MTCKQWKVTRIIKQVAYVMATDENDAINQAEDRDVWDWNTRGYDDDYEVECLTKQKEKKDAKRKKTKRS